MPQNAFFPWTSNLLVSQKMTQGHFFPTLHPLSLVIFATATVVAFVLLHNSRFSFHCYTQCEVMPTQKLAQKWHCDLLQHLVWKITKGIHSCKPASLNHPIEGVPYQISILNKFSVPFTCTDLYIDLTDTENNTEWLWSVIHWVDAANWFEMCVVCACVQVHMNAFHHLCITTFISELRVVRVLLLMPRAIILVPAANLMNWVVEGLRRARRSAEWLNCSRSKYLQQDGKKHTSLHHSVELQV